MIAARRRVRLVLERHSRATDERGVMLVWTAIMIVVFLGVTAFAIDVAYWHLVKGREQRAADAAALAGAVTFPGNRTLSDNAAKDIADKNGYTVGAVTQVGSTGSCPLSSGDVAVCTGPGEEAFQYKVWVTKRVQNIFGGIFGIGETTISATATAEYLPPLTMGSPTNQFGNDPDNTSWPIDANHPPQTYPNMWANIEGGGTAKQQGDAYAANWCDNNVTDGCSAVGDGNNLNYTSKGYYYTVDFTGPGSVDLQAFDPAFVHVGQFCNDPSADLAGAAALATIPGYPEASSDIATRFRPVGDPSTPSDPGFRYCSGDNSFPNSSSGNNPGPSPNTTFTVLKASVPGDPSSASVVCGPRTFPGYRGSVKTALQNNNPAGFATYFRQWASLCTVNGQTGDEYFIQVQTDNGSGSNHFALRGVTSGNTAGPVTIAGNAYMSIYANVGSNQLTKFYLARVPPAAAGHTLVLNFYDIGDAGTTSNHVEGTLHVNPPDVSNVGSDFGDCRWTGSNGSAVGYARNTQLAPWGDATPIGNCFIDRVNSDPNNWQAQWSTVTIKIPGDYTCDDDDPLGCWLTIDYKFDGQVHDVTSWNAYLLGDPVRLTQ